MTGEYKSVKSCKESIQERAEFSCSLNSGAITTEKYGKTGQTSHFISLFDFKRLFIDTGVIKGHFATALKSVTLEEEEISWTVTDTGNVTRLCFAGGPAMTFSTVDLVPLIFYLNLPKIDPASLGDPFSFNGAIRVPVNVSDVNSSLQLEELKIQVLKESSTIKWTVSHDIAIGMQRTQGFNITITLNRLNVPSRTFPKRAVIGKGWTYERNNGNLTIHANESFIIIDGPKKFMAFDAINGQNQPPLTEITFDGYSHSIKDTWESKELIICTEDLDCVMIAAKTSSRLILFLIIGGSGCLLVFGLNIWGCIYLKKKRRAQKKASQVKAKTAASVPKLPKKRNRRTEDIEMQEL